MKTLTPKPNEITRNWHLIDAKNQILGRLATQTASFLIGKNKTNFVSNIDCGDYVVITNAKNIKTTGKKLVDKIYHHHTGFPGGLRSTSLAQQLEKDPRKVIEAAVSGMLPKNKLRDLRLRRLKVFTDDNHPYQDKFKEQ